MKKKLTIKIDILENNFNIKTNFKNCNSLNSRDKSMLLIALYQLKNDIDKVSSEIRNNICTK